MIDLRRPRPRELAAHERLLARLPKHHEKYQFVSDRVYQLGAGYAGELEVDRMLHEIGLPDNHTVMKGITLEVLPNFYIQLDTLIITRHCLILLEIKMYAGTIQLDEATGKTVKTSSNGEVEKYSCAVHQVDRAVYGLTRILEPLQIPLPIYPILVMANERTEIAQYPSTLPVKYKNQLPKYIRQLLSTSERVTERERLTVERHINSSLFNKQPPPLCERYSIPVTELKRGVLCPHCNEAMARTQGRSWTCARCNWIDQTAGKEAVLDWFYLAGSTLTNQQLQQFISVKPKSATRLLGKFPFTRIGKTKGTYYVYDDKRQSNPRHV